MPIHRHGGQENAQHDALVASLLCEWRNPHDEGAAGNHPEIHIIEGDPIFGIGRQLKLIVVWDAWADLDFRERSIIIMDAFQEAAENPEDILRVTAPLGLTTSDADRAILGMELGE